MCSPDISLGSRANLCAPSSHVIDWIASDSAARGTSGPAPSGGLAPSRGYGSRTTTVDLSLDGSVAGRFDQRPGDGGQRDFDAFDPAGGPVPLLAHVDETSRRRAVGERA